ncbi:unnamed protein product [Dicrocoelium dendriticum]|nr:unnamed protein product [Dicrocoelium dendriticum]
MNSIVRYPNKCMRTVIKSISASSFQGRRLFELVYRKVSIAARVPIRIETVALITQRLKHRLPVESNSCVVYQSTCTCVAIFIRHTSRRLSKELAEHCSASLQHGTVKNMHSSISKHLLNVGQQIRA